jgi:hypothetical protein
VSTLNIDPKIAADAFAKVRGIRPLDGIRVIDVSIILAGPFCSTQLGEFGAEVMKTELPEIGDALRRFGSVARNGDTLPWLSECRNKKSITLDLRTPGNRSPCPSLTVLTVIGYCQVFEVFSIASLKSCRVIARCFFSPRIVFFAFTGAP